jgi:hypothetical protein
VKCECAGTATATIYVVLDENSYSKNSYLSIDKNIIISQIASWIKDHAILLSLY